MPDFETLKWAAQLGGGWLAFLVLLLLHREDRQRRNELEDKLLGIIATSATADEKSIVAARSLVEALDRLGVTLGEYHRAEIVWMDKIATLADKTHHGVATLVEKANVDAWRRASREPE